MLRTPTKLWTGTHDSSGIKTEINWGYLGKYLLCGLDNSPPALNVTRIVL